MLSPQGNAVRRVLVIALAEISSQDQTYRFEELKGDKFIFTMEVIEGYLLETRDSLEGLKKGLAVHG